MRMSSLIYSKKIQLDRRDKMKALGDVHFGSGVSSDVIKLVLDVLKDNKIKKIY